MSEKTAIIPFERIASVIHSRRFPVDFMFELGKTEFAEWRSQFVTSKTESLETTDLAELEAACQRLMLSGGGG